MKLHKKNIFVGAVLLWICIIFSFSLQPAEVSQDLSSGLGRVLLEQFFPEVLESAEDSAMERLEFLHFLLRKAAHFTEYFVLGVLVTIALRKFAWKRNAHRNLVVIILCALVASMDETIQLFVSGRSGQVSDVLLDCTGALAGMGVLTGFLFVKNAILRLHYPALCCKM